MRRIVVPIILIFLLAFLIVPPDVVAVSEGISVAPLGGESLYLYNDYHALVVGVSNYAKWPQLPNAVSDAREVSRFLKRMGFKVTLLTDPNSQELKKALKNLVGKTGLEPDRAIVFYYAGQGETQTLADGTKLGWIIPRDSPQLLNNPKGFEQRAISMKEIESYSRQMRSKHVLMFFDSTFSDGVFSLEPPVLEIISEKSGLPVRQYIIAGRENEPLPDQSTFKRFLLEGLLGDADIVHDGYITGSELGVYLLDRVAKKTRDLQHPQYGKIGKPDLARGDFIFHQIAKKPETGQLFVKTDPEGARVRVLNIQPRFSQGIELDPGRYHLEASAAGYEAKRQWVELEAGEVKTVDIRLSKPTGVFTNSLGMKFVLIPAGSFVMGSPVGENGRAEDEKQHRVRLTKSFYLQTTEVTVGQFRHFVRATGYETEAETKGGCWVSTEGGGWKKTKGSNWDNPGSWETATYKQKDRHPVTCVSANDAKAFIQWLNRQEGKNYGLPTEAEWEYASRAGTSEPFGFGRCLSTDQANYGGIGPFFLDCSKAYRVNRKRPIAVASLEANRWGLFDMHGNVSEWCQDWYDRYPEGSVSDPKGASSGTERVMRGGHWGSKADGCRSAKRWRFPPNIGSDAVGFRLVLR